MAEEILGKKISDLPEKTEPVDTDVYVFGDAGTNVLKKAKWSNMLSKIVSKLAANNLTTTIAGYFLDARQGKALKDSIDELNTKINGTEKTITSGFSNGFAGTVKTLSSGKVKFVFISVTGSVDGNWKKICNLGSDFATDAGAFQAAVNVNRTTPGMIRVTPSGDLEVYANTSVTSVATSLTYF